MVFGIRSEVSVDTLTEVTYSDDSLKAIVDEFVSDYKDFTGKELKAGKSSEGKANAFNFKKAAPDELLGDEGYTMDIKSDRIDVQSVSVTGNMYGMQTILQMYKGSEDGGYSIGTMRDYPRYETRGFLLDVARKPVSLEMMKEITRTMRYYKMNDFHGSICRITISGLANTEKMERKTMRLVRTRHFVLNPD